jgi:Zn finger protein HypA/HybF involved in hydrogenase expression
MADAKTKDTKIKVVCLECGKKFQVRVYANECPKCGGTDIDVRD